MTNDRPTGSIAPQTNKTFPYIDTGTLVDDPVALVDDPVALVGNQTTIVDGLTPDTDTSVPSAVIKIYG